MFSVFIFDSDRYVIVHLLWSIFRGTRLCISSLRRFSKSSSRVLVSNGGHCRNSSWWFCLPEWLVMCDTRKVHWQPKQWKCVRDRKREKRDQLILHVLLWAVRVLMWATGVILSSYFHATAREREGKKKRFGVCSPVSGGKNSSTITFHFLTKCRVNGKFWEWETSPEVPGDSYRNPTLTTFFHHLHTTRMRPVTGWLGISLLATVYFPVLPFLCLFTGLLSSHVSLLLFSHVRHTSYVVCFVNLFPEWPK